MYFCLGLASMGNAISFPWEGKLITLLGYQYKDLPAAFRSHSWLSMKGKRVLGVGASIGNSAIYFALRGTREVVAFEPYPLFMAQH
ncbi:MAG: hypothetical protein ACP5UU_05865 [Thermoprotei archaeon]